jgi:hypothetical protein
MSSPISAHRTPIPSSIDPHWPRESWIGPGMPRSPSALVIILTCDPDDHHRWKSTRVPCQVLYWIGSGGKWDNTTHQEDRASQPLSIHSWRSANQKPTGE